MIATATKKVRKSKDSDSDSDRDNSVEWKIGLSSIQQMYISQEYKHDTSLALGVHVSSPKYFETTVLVLKKSISKLRELLTLN